MSHLFIIQYQNPSLNSCSIGNSLAKKCGKYLKSPNLHKTDKMIFQMSLQSSKLVNNFRFVKRKQFSIIESLHLPISGKWRDKSHIQNRNWRLHCHLTHNNLFINIKKKNQAKMVLDVI